MNYIKFCEFNIDTASVELKLIDDSMVSIYCDAVEAEYARNVYEVSELGYLIYNEPISYVRLLLSGKMEEYLRNSTDCTPISDMRQMGTEIQTVKNQMTLKNWAEEVAECQSSGMTVSAWCELHGIKVKTYYYRLRRVRESLLTESRVVPLSTKNISDNIEIFSGDMRIRLSGM